tara:strand:- start:49128 stop:50318 length:1191 start_codon:yes stop_codon:yes gene_type:complete
MKNLIFILLTFPFFSLAQDTECIDSTAIDPDCMCFDMYDPVLGCNGITYTNQCYAQCDGVQFWESVNQGGADVCDLIEVSILSSNNEAIVFEYETYFDSDVSFAYAGFVLIDEMGDTVAVETIENANNVYGIYGQMQESRMLESYNLGYELPLEAQLHLIEGFFAGNPESVCSISIQIFQGPSEGDTLELSGQWYSSGEDEYLEFDADSIHLYTFDQDLECYDFFSLAYQANDSLIFVQGEEEMMSLSYFLSETQFSLIFEETLNYVPQAFDSSTFDQCEEQSFDCTPDGCISLSSFEGEFDDLEDCEFECVQEQFQSWNCIDGNCEMLNDSSGTYNTYQSCIDVCSVTDLTDYQLSKKVIKITDLLGREVSPNSDQIIILYYEDGSIEKKYFLKR